MRVKWLVGPHKGKIVDMPTMSAQAGIAAKHLEPVVTMAEKQGAEILPTDKDPEPQPSKNKRTRRG